MNAPGLARADDAVAAPIRFTSLAPDGVRSEVDVELVLGDLTTEATAVEATGLHLDAQYLPMRGAGGYARLGVASVSSRFESSWVLTGAELGGLQRVRVGAASITGRVGVTLPVEPEEELGALAVVRARRPSDLAWLAERWPTNRTRLRLAVTPTYVRRLLTVRVDLGLDAAPTTSEPLTYHVDVAVGVRHGRAGAALEFATFGWLDDEIEAHRHAATLGVQYQLGRTVVILRLGTPFTTGNVSRYTGGPGMVVDPLPVQVGEFLAVTVGASIAL